MDLPHKIVDYLDRRTRPYVRYAQNSLKRFRLRARGVAFRELHCLGDSHVEALDFLGRRDMLPHTLIDATIVPGATAQGAANPHSRTNALSTFMRTLRALDRTTHLLFLLGEVDCGFVIWYRAEKHGISVQEQLENSLDRYFELLATVQGLGFRHLYVATAPPPTIRDGQDFGEIANLRREVKATQRERTELTLRYNAELRVRCLAHGYAVIDIERDVLAPTGLVSPAFMHPDSANHHLDPAKVAPLYARELRALGFA